MTVGGGDCVASAWVNGVRRKVSADSSNLSKSTRLMLPSSGEIARPCGAPCSHSALNITIGRFITSVCAKVAVGPANEEMPNSIPSSPSQYSASRRLTLGERSMRLLIALLVIIYLVGVGVALAPTIKDKWGSASASDLATSVAQDTCPMHSRGRQGPTAA